MARPKLTEEDKAAKEREAKRQQIVENLAESLKELRKSHIPKNPTRIFKWGDWVSWGAHDKVLVLEVLDNNTIYRVRTYQGQANPENTHFTDHWQAWTHLETYRTPTQNEAIPDHSKRDIWNLTFLQQDMSSLFNKVYSRGVNFDPEYQRGRVWDEADKVALIDSVMSNIEIGKFVLVRVYDPEDRFDYEVLDGKQRIIALTEFFEGRFLYKGLTYDQMSRRDKTHFFDQLISIAEVRDLTLVDKCAYFIRLNTAGRPQDAEHLEAVRKLGESALV